MNRVELVGRITKNVELRKSTSGVSIVRFTLAVKRLKKDDNDDFISCVAFGNTAEFMEKYVKKGYLLSIEGRLQTGSYEKQDGTKVYTTDVMCDSVQNLTPKNTESDNTNNNNVSNTNELDIDSSDLPF